MLSNPDGTGPHLVPPPPPRTAQRKQRKKQGEPRYWIWPLALVSGIALGIVGYQFIAGIDFYFDYWLAAALS